jgi:hypothetical protein
MHTNHLVLARVFLIANSIRKYEGQSSDPGQENRVYKCG